MDLGGRGRRMTPSDNDLRLLELSLSLTKG